MAIKYTRVFTFEGDEAENVRRGIALIHGLTSSLSMTELRGLVVKHSAGSYAKFADLFALNRPNIEITEVQARTLVDVANDLCAKASDTDIRKLKTWLSALLADMKMAKENRNEENGREQSRSMANAS